MAQFSVHRNPNVATRGSVPFLLDIQTDLIADLGTRVVVPLYPVARMKGAVLQTLTPVFTIEGKAYVMMTPQLAGIPVKELGPVVADLAARRAEIVAAVDLLITGI